MAITSLSKANKLKLVTAMVNDASKKAEDALSKKVAKFAQEYWTEYKQKYSEFTGLSEAEVARLMGLRVIAPASGKWSKGTERANYALGYTLPKEFYRFHNGVGIRLDNHCSAPSAHQSDFEVKVNSAKATVLIKEAIKITTDKQKLSDDLTQILSPVRTMKQLKATLPEAEKYFSSKTANQIIPSKLVEDVQARLRTGIPD